MPKGKISLACTLVMSDALYMSFHNAIGDGIISRLHEQICPLIEYSTPAWTSYWWLPMENMPIIDIIHAFSVSHTYHPKYYKNYNWKIYFLVCLVAMGPSSTLRAIMTGRPWSFTGSPTTVPSLVLAMLITHWTGGLPAPLIGLIRLLNVMSTVTSVESGMRSLYKFPEMNAAAMFMIGLANTGGGTIWSVLVDAWFGSGQYKWSRVNEQFPRWVFVSLMWNAVILSNCSLTPHNYALVEIYIYVILLADAIHVLARTPPPPSPAPSAPSSSDPTSSSTKKVVPSTSSSLTFAKQKKD